jgi:heptosyltransferase I
MKIAIVKLSALGDIVHAMVVLQFIKKFNKEISIDWIVEETYKDLLENNPDINQLHIINLRGKKSKKSLLAIIRELNNVRKLTPYDLVIDMQGLIKSAIVSKLIPSTTTLGFDKFSIREGFASFFYNTTFSCAYDRNIIERNINLVEFAFGFRVEKKQIHIKDSFLFSREQKLNLKLSKTKKNILLIPGASFKSKCYPVAKLAELSTLIDANFITIWGNKREKLLAEEIKNLAPDVHICKKLNIDSLKSLISEVDLVIGPDTGPTHIAWALNIASITLFGPTPGFRNTYKTNINRIIESKSNVNPYKIKKNDYSIKDIKVVDIVKISHTLLKLNK